MRENAEAKGRRYLTEGRLTLHRVDGTGADATCRGDGRLYCCGLHPTWEWWCECPAKTDRCSHLVALRLVVLITERSGR